MNELLTKISAYNLVSYALTGLILLACYSVPHDIKFELNPAIFFGLIYAVGLAASRIGSLAIEWALRKIRFVKYAAYPDFVSGEKIDPKVSGLSEQAAFYRTLMTGFLGLAIYATADGRVPSSVFSAGWVEICTFLATAILFAFAYRKQCQFVVDRIAANLRTEIRQ